MPSRYESRRNERREKRLTRKDFNRFLVVWMTTMFVTRGITKLALANTAKPESVSTPTIVPTPKDEPISGELLTLMGEIEDYRRVFQMPGLPRELNDEHIEAARKYDPSKEFQEFSMELPEHERSFGMRTKEILTQVFGPDFNRLIDSVTALGHPGKQEFDSGNRNINLTVDLHNSYKMDKGFDELVLHEGQHGIHPALHLGLYPLDKLIKVSHGIWRALSKTNKYEKDLYGGLIFQYAKRKVTEMIAKKFVEDINLEGQVDYMGYSNITQVLAGIANSRGIKMEEIKFSKKVCAELGDEFFNMIMSGDIEVKGELQKEWTEMMEGGFVEIVADMFRFAILDPDKIGHDKDIIAGTEEMMSAIQGRKVTVDEVREQLKEVSPEIMLRYKSEEAYLYPEVNIITPGEEQTPIPTLTTDEVANIKEYEEQVNGGEDDFDLFVKQAIIPERVGSAITKEQLEIMERYAQYVKHVYLEYPMIFEATSSHNMSFDPELHIWETRRIGVATDKSVIWNLLADPTLIPDYIDRIMNRTQVLSDFVNSPAFGTNNYAP